MLKVNKLCRHNIHTPNRRTLSLLSNSVHTQQKNLPKNVSIVEFVVVVMLI